MNVSRRSPWQLWQYYIPYLLLAFPTPAAPQVSTADLVERAAPGVVLISIQGKAGKSIGSGFIVDSDGTILTNYHVVEDATAATVKLPSGEIFDQVEVLIEDRRRDIAILRIAGFGLPSLNLGNSDSVRIGESVVVIGNPLGLETSVSTGVLSGRRDPGAGYELLQISAPISPGSSGGPVIGAEGTVIGIAVSAMRDGQNLNFAIPINYARGLLGRANSTDRRLLSPVVDDKPASTAVDNPEVDLSAFGSFTLEYENRIGEHTHHVRLTYWTDSTSGRETRLEKTYHIERRHRNTKQGEMRERSIAEGSRLRPVAFHYASNWWDGTAWRTQDATIHFDGYRALGNSNTSAEGPRRVDVALPEGVILSSFSSAPLVGALNRLEVGQTLSVVAYDPLNDQLNEVSFRVRGTARRGIAGRMWDAVRVEIASGASVSTAYFSVMPPHILLESEGAGSSQKLVRFSPKGD